MIVNEFHFQTLPVDIETNQPFPNHPFPNQTIETAKNEKETSILLIKITTQLQWNKKNHREKIVVCFSGV